MKHRFSFLGPLAALVCILGAFNTARPHEPSGVITDAVDNAVRAQALDVAAQLQNAGPILKQAVQSGSLKIIAARYDLHSGKVSLLSPAQK